MGFRKRKDADGPELPDEFGGGVKTMMIDVDGTSIRVIRLDQLPIMRVIPVLAEENASKQMEQVMYLLKDSLMDPADWDTHLAGISIEGLHKVLSQWTKSLEGK